MSATPINPLRRLVALLPTEPVVVGEVTASSGGFCSVTLPGGSVVQAKGSPGIGARVFVRAGVVQGPAPSLPLVAIDV